MLGSLIIYLKGMRRMMFQLSGFYHTWSPKIRGLGRGGGFRVAWALRFLRAIVNPGKLEHGFRMIHAGIPYTLRA